MKSDIFRNKIWKVKVKEKHPGCLSVIMIIAERHSGCFSV
ncbi:hypothetical protein CLOSYM_01696 [[Clostridium] symbiosum ATCC 14940]|uniref:Uncharacterized protein n=1 Tax=[Clostridium] symbiosum ATCC 14940 TaxID=411472 RepID=A0ABC9TZK0_CLOSY|nr:hypothetical protein CLOSYM_01696 [[Clostridium] symbiosum ATCC 14940]